MVTRPDGSLLNTCSSDVLAEMLRFLKRAYWPFPWQSGGGGAGGGSGGFVGAAKVRGMSMHWLRCCSRC